MLNEDESEGSLSKRILCAHKKRPFSKLILGRKELEKGEVKLQLRNEDLILKIPELAEELLKRVAIPQ